jgi:hypothetical protein
MKQSPRHLGTLLVWTALVGLCWQGANAQQEINRLRPPMPIPNVAPIPPPRMVALMPPTAPLLRSTPGPIPPDIRPTPAPVALMPPPIPPPPERPAIPAMMPVLSHVALPPAEYDHEYTGKLTVLKEDDYTFIRYVCRNTANAIACSYRTYDLISGAPISCLIMLGPGTWTDERVMRHELGHCNGWSNKHEGAR